MRKCEKRFCEDSRIRCTFSLKIQFFIIFGVTLVPYFEIFSQFQEMHFYESLLQHRNILRKSEKRFCEALWIRCNFSLNIQFFIIFGLTLVPDFVLLSRFQEMRFTSSASWYHAKMPKTVLCGFADPMHLFIKYSILHNLWPNFGPRFWGIFSISGNALLNHFFSIVISCEKAKNGSGRFCGSDALFIKPSIFHNLWPNFGPRFWDIFSISGNALMNHFFSIAISCEKANNGSLWFCGSDAPFH